MSQQKIRLSQDGHHGVHFHRNKLNMDAMVSNVDKTEYRISGIKVYKLLPVKSLCVDL